MNVIIPRTLKTNKYDKCKQIECNYNNSTQNNMIECDHNENTQNKCK